MKLQYKKLACCRAAIMIHAASRLPVAVNLGVGSCWCHSPPHLTVSVYKRSCSRLPTGPMRYSSGAPSNRMQTTWICMTSRAHACPGLAIYKQQMILLFYISKVGILIRNNGDRNASGHCSFGVFATMLQCTHFDNTTRVIVGLR